jgi:hypothetical protein
MIVKLGDHLDRDGCDQPCGQPGHRFRHPGAEQVGRGQKERQAAHGRTLDLNRQAQHELTCENRLVVIPDVTHPLEEPTALRSSADLAREWFITHLRTPNR